MGVDIQTYRARIGSFKHSLGHDVVTQTVVVNLPLFRRLITSMMLCVAVMILFHLESNAVLKFPHYNHGLSLRNCDYELGNLFHSWMPLTLIFILKVIGYTLLLALVLPNIHFTVIGIPDSADGRYKWDKTSDTRMNVIRNNVTYTAVCAVCLIGSVSFIGMLLFMAGVEPNPGPNDKGATFSDQIVTSDLTNVIRDILAYKTTFTFCLIGSVSFIGMLLLIAGVEPNPGPNGGRQDHIEPSEKSPHIILKKLGLCGYFPEKIELFKVLSKQTVADEGKETNLPWILLRRLIFVNVEAFHLDEENDSTDSSDESTSGEEGASEEYTEPRTKLNYLDVFLGTFQCCSPMLKQVLVKKMYLCRFAVPFLFTPINSDKPVVSIWPIRSLTIETCPDGKRMRDYNAMFLPTKCVAFCRIGRPECSKSHMLNEVLSEEGTNSKIFLNNHDNAHTVDKLISSKYIETFWLPKVGTDKDKFDTTTMFFNMRGCVREFGKDTMEFMSNVVDTLVVFANINDVLSMLECESIIPLFRTTIFVVVGVFGDKAQDLKSKLRKAPEDRVDIMRTHDKKSKSKSQNKIVKKIVKLIKKQNSNERLLSLEERLANFSKYKIITDEHETLQPACECSKRKAVEFCSGIDFDGSIMNVMKEVTPVQYTIAKQLGKRIKELKKSKDYIAQEALRTDIRAMRKNITETISRSIKDFLHFLDTSCSIEEVEYFIAWSDFFISTNCRNQLPNLQQRHEHDISTESSMDSCEFSLATIFREIGLIYDSACELNIHENEVQLPAMDTVASMFGKLIVRGRQFELLDGDVFYLAAKWFTAIMKSVYNEKHCKILTICALGVQSSGKSTLLNTMFGTSFATSAGRCTSGINAQIIPIGEEVKSANARYNFALILDTEGLRPVKANSDHRKGDNELATLIAALGDITLAIVMGENVQEMSDILQIVTHAFIRLKLVNTRLDLNKQCKLVLQNMTSPAAENKLTSEMYHLVKKLDSMKMDSLRCEEVDDISPFDSVIKLNERSDIFYLTHVWNGNPPFARVNREYSKKAMDIKLSLLEEASKRQLPQGKTIIDFMLQTVDVWHGVLSETFVFSFKNSLERKIHLAMDEWVQDRLCDVESGINEYIHNFTRNEFYKCSENEIDKCKLSIQAHLNKTLGDKKNQSEDDIRKYFDTCEHATIAIQWKECQMGRVHRLFDKYHFIIKNTIKTERRQFERKQFLRRCRKQHVEYFHKESLKYAKPHSVKDLTPDKVRNLFETIWDKAFSGYKPEQESRNDILKQSFRDFISDKYHNYAEFNNIFQKLHSWNEPSNNGTESSLDVDQTGINENDFNKTVHFHVLFHRAIDMKNVGLSIKSLSKAVDVKIRMLCEKNDQITEYNIRDLLRYVLERITKMNSEIKCRVTFHIKLLVQVSLIAEGRFRKHNYEYTKTIAKEFEGYKLQQRLVFENCLKLRKTENAMAEFLANVIHKYLEKDANRLILKGIKDHLRANLPRTKTLLIHALCTDFVNTGGFLPFIQYIKYPFEAGYWWFDRKASEFLFEGNQSRFESICTEITRSILMKVHESFKKLETINDVSIARPNLVKVICFSLNENKIIIPEAAFESVKYFSQVDEVNFKVMRDTIETELENSMKKMVDSYTGDSMNTEGLWKGINPIYELFENIWGCPEMCPYCNEPCENSSAQHSEEHRCVQHRPVCCLGMVSENPNKACVHTCCYSVFKNLKHNCRAFNYICNDGATDCKKRSHRYGMYRTHVNNWSIPKHPDMHDSSKFWLWFVGKYKNDLKEHYGYEITEIPQSWSEISQQDAVLSLGDYYS